MQGMHIGVCRPHWQNVFTVYSVATVTPVEMLTNVAGWFPKVPYR